MPYAIKSDGSSRSVDADWELHDDEVLYEDIPQWAVDKMVALEEYFYKKIAEDSWRVRELSFVADQIIAIQDEDPSALPVDELEWRSYRTTLRAWKEGNPDFPDESKRPTRPIGGFV